MCSIDVSPNTIQQGGSATLSWSTDNADSASLSGAGSVGTSGSFAVTPTQTTTYELTASNEVATAHCSTTITVTNPPPPPAPAPTCVLEADPTSIAQGGSSTLRWGVTNATSVTLAGSQTASIHSGQLVVTPSQTTTYTLTARGNGGTVTCTATVTVIPPAPTAPVCTLVANPTAIAAGGASTLSWTTSNASNVSIDTGIGQVSTSGGRNVAPAQTTTYTLTAVGNGGTVHCSATVTVVPQTPTAPVCTLSAAPTTILQGSAATLSWTTSNASNVSITNIGSVSTSGSSTVAPAQTTTYVLTATGTGGTVNCSATIVVVPPVVTPNAPTCTLSANPTNIASGGVTTLSWTTTNATSFVIDQGVGQVETGNGSRTVNPGGSRTYVGTAYGPGGTVTCVTSVSVNTGTPGPSCTMNVSPSVIRQGDSATLTWDSNSVRDVTISPSVGSVGQSGNARIYPPNGSGTYTYQGVFYGFNGNSITCSATLRVETPQQNLVLDSLPVVGNQPLSYVYLADLPYTGLDLGPVGTAIYWLMLILWSLAVAYLVLWGMVPAGLRRFGLAGATASYAPASIAPAAHTPAAPVMHSAPAAPAAARTHTSYEGFKALASEGALTIDDIVKGLAREADDSHLLAPPAVAAPIAVAAAQAAATVTQSPAALLPPAHQDVPAFLTALLAGEKEAVFGIVRDITKAGGDAQEFITHAIMALDDAYRAKTEGSTVHPEVARVCENCTPTFLEKLITSLSTALDSSYSAGTTGVKLAVTRALAAVNG
ncbi:MAG: hypothetical protein JWO84_599 [Parcubacteria group bacterium]|nr:hypothetical protein [Parcubacteria group bacterium]